MLVIRHHSDVGEQSERKRPSRNVQLQQDPVRVAVDKTLLALLAEVLLEGGDSLRVVSLQATYDLGDFGGPFLWVLVVGHDERLGLCRVAAARG